MKTQKIVFVAAISAVVSLGIIATATAQNKNGSGKERGSKTFNVESFSALKASHGVDVYISIGAEQSISAVGPKDKMDRLEVFVKNDTLHVRRGNGKRGWSWGNNQNYRVTVVTPTLNAIDASSGADVDAVNLNADKIVLDSSSGSDIDVSGRCVSLTADASSGSDIDASELVCENATADVSSGADIDLYASVSFVGDASSGSDITVLGSPPKVSTSTSSGGDITIR